MCLTQGAAANNSSPARDTELLLQTEAKNSEIREKCRGRGESLMVVCCIFRSFGSLALICGYLWTWSSVEGETGDGERIRLDLHKAGPNTSVAN